MTTKRRKGHKRRQSRWLKTLIVFWFLLCLLRLFVAITVSLLKDQFSAPRDAQSVADPVEFDPDFAPLAEQFLGAHHLLRLVVGQLVAGVVGFAHRAVSCWQL